MLDPWASPRSPGWSSAGWRSHLGWLCGSGRPSAGLTTLTPVAGRWIRHSGRVHNGVLLIAASPAGSTTRPALDAARRVLAEFFPVELVQAADPAGLAEVLDARAGRTPVVAGGDGSLHLVVAALRARGELAGTPVGLVPLGTGNDLARAVGIPRDPAVAARVVTAGSARAMDLLADDAGGIAVNAVHLGVGALAARLGARLKRPLGPMAYRAGGILAGLRAGRWALEVELDEVPVAAGRLLQVGIGNGPYVGGGTRLFPGARHDDGRLHLVTSADTGPVARASYAVAVRRGRHVRRGTVHYRSGQRVTVSGGSVPSNVDGELAELRVRRTWSVEPGAWRLLAPRTSGG